MDINDIIKRFGAKHFAKIVKLAMWTCQGEEFELDLNYMDDEIIQFKFRRPLSQIIPEKVN